jgi:hypothetical protein
MVPDAVDRKCVAFSGGDTPFHCGDPLADGQRVAIAQPRLGVSHQKIVDVSLVSRQQAPVSRRHARHRSVSDSTSHACNFGAEKPKFVDESLRYCLTGSSTVGDRNIDA